MWHSCHVQNVWIRTGIAALFGSVVGAIASVGGLILMDDGVDRCLPALQDSHTDAAARGAWIAWTAYLAVVVVGSLAAVSLSQRTRTWVIVGVVTLIAMGVAVVGMHDFGVSMCETEFSRSQRG
ncbi:hypothetical protein ACN95_16810 [Gordonia sihwensis]|uniref:Uncharacterized protein n=1 Tax=Gordonia cholesterolivorans TaxID=559625 RepID=A0ABP5UKQ9_9ACTN|nr:hypothetical protein [Gordonia sihwensis]